MSDPEAQKDTKTCKKEACAIQTCLKNNDYQQQMCSAAVKALVECCRKSIGPNVHCAFPAKKKM
jgi:hypothetical protein